MLALSSICTIWDTIVESLNNLWQTTGIYSLFNGQATWQNLVMIAISFVLVYLAIVKKFEPLLLLPIAFGMFIVNIPGAYRILFGDKGYIITDIIANSEVARGDVETLCKLFNVDSLDAIKNILAGSTDITLSNGLTYTAGSLVISSETVVGNYGLFYYIYKGVDWVIFPPIIFLGIGVMTDFGPLIANPKSMFMGAAAQLGIFLTFVGASLMGFEYTEAGAIAIIGGADGPTAIYVTKKLAEHLLPQVAIAAYSYMALIPLIQKPIMRLLTTEKERKIKMKQLRKVSKVEKIVFPLLVSLVVGLILPDAMPLLGMLMNTVTIFLGLMVGSKAVGSVFLSPATLGIIVLGLVAFCMGTMGGLLVAKLMSKFSKEPINPLIGSAGVSAVPMAARISQDVGREADPNNHLLMHAMGPNVAGVIGSAIAAGVLLALYL